MGDVSQEGVRVVFVVHPAAVVLQAVANNEVIYVHKHVVGRYLVEHFLRERHRRSLVFDEHHGLRRRVVQHAVAPQALVADAKFHLVGKE